MFSPNAGWRCTEDLKVIIITKEGKLSRAPAQRFFQHFGKVTACFVLKQETIVCGVFTTEEDAEEALKHKHVKIGGMNCEVTTFKSGNRKIYIDLYRLTVSENAIRLYFEKNYGTILRVEKNSNNTAVFILFLKVDSSVACRNKTHIINGVTIYARPGCIPGTEHQPDRSTMYRVSPRLSTYVSSNPPHDSPRHSAYPFPPSDPNGESSISSRIHAYSLPFPHVPSSILAPPLNDASNSSSCSAQSLIPFSNISPIFRDLLEELRDLSIDEIDRGKKRIKKVVDLEDSIINWRKTHVKVVEAEVKKRGIKITAVSSFKRKEDHEGMMNNEEKMEKEQRLNEEIVSRAVLSIDDKWLRWEQIRKELNLPPINPCVHYARDEDGFPIHCNGKYVHSILRDGRFRFKENHHVSFNAQRDTVQLFKRAAEEYEFFGPRNPSKAENLLAAYNQNEIGGLDGAEMNSSTLKDALPHHLKWPIEFPARPPHFPLMEHCTCEDDLSLDINIAVRYMNHLEVKWKNTKQHNFLSTFAPFLREYCTVCRIKLDGPRKQFQHIFSRPHLVNLNRNKVKYSPSDFTFWNNTLNHNFDIGGKRRASR